MKPRMISFIFIMLSVCLLLIGCTETPEQTPPGQTEKDAESSTPAPEEQTPSPVSPTPGEETPAVDLTALSSTMVYAEVYNMMLKPEDYIGKTVKMRGQFSIYQAVLEDGTPSEDEIYYACVIADATACCEQGIEFLWGGEHRYPEDYPELGSDITVTGEFQTYEEDGLMYCQLVEADLSYEK